jgi:uncharacterized phage protein (TIGR02218 family)
MSWLEGPLTSIALCWRIARRDGVTIGLTAHDRDLAIGGLVYRAAPGMTPSAIQRSASLDADSMDVTGALSSAAIGEADLLAGRWDGARVEIFATDWSAAGARVMLGDGMLTAELKGIAAALERPVVEETSPECRAELGDKRCRIAIAGRRRFALVTAIDGAVLTLDAGEPAANCYGGGRLRWFGGANSGLEDAVARSEGATVTLRRAPRFASPGRVELIEGCDKSFATCGARFGNAVNFRGEPYLPGTDLLTRYPGG